MCSHSGGAVAIGTLPEEGGCNVLHYDLSLVVALDGYWEAPPTPSLSPVSSEANSQREVPQHGDRNTHSLLELAETHMKNYVRLRWVIRSYISHTALVHAMR